jgi:hypothetical protein
LTVGWPPQLTLKRVPGDVKALHPLFVFLEDKRLLRYGYGTQAGIASLDDLANRVDVIRAELFAALTALRPDAPIAEWLRKLEDAAHELLTKTYAAMSERATTAPEPADVAPAVNQLRDAFGLGRRARVRCLPVTCGKEPSRPDPERHSVARGTGHVPERRQARLFVASNPTISARSSLAGCRTAETRMRHHASSPSRLRLRSPSRLVDEVPEAQCSRSCGAFCSSARYCLPCSDQPRFSARCGGRCWAHIRLRRAWGSSAIDRPTLHRLPAASGSRVDSWRQVSRRRELLPALLRHALLRPALQLHDRRGERTRSQVGPLEARPVNQGPGRDQRG